MDSESYFREFLRLLTLLKSRVVPYAIGMIGSSLTGSGFSIVMAFVFKNMIDAAVNGEMALLVRSGIMVCGAALGLSILGPVFSYLSSRSVQKTMNDIELRVYRHSGMLPVAYYDRSHSGDLISRVNHDIGDVWSAFGSYIPSSVNTFIRGVGSIFSMFVLEWRLAIMLLLFGIASAFINTRFAKPFRIMNNKKNKYYALLTEKLIDLLAGFNTMKIFHIEDTIVGYYRDFNEEATTMAVGRGQKHAVMECANSLMSYLSFVATIAAGSFMVFSGIITFGTVIAVVQLLGGVTGLFMQIGGVVALVQRSLAGSSRLFELLDHPSEPERYMQKPDLPEDGSTRAASAVIEMRNIGFYYEEGTPILKGLTLSVDQGKMAALVGPSGGGKSTVIKLLLGYYPWQNGTIYLKGRPISDYTLDEIRNLTAYVSQDPYLFDNTIEENIRYGRLDASQDEIIAAAKAANAHDFIMEHPEGYQSRVGERGVRLSGGEKQRIAIARALLKDAPILLLDEATSSLDSENEQLVQGALNVLMEGRTTIVIAHRLSTIEKADVIYVIDQGRVVQQGSHEELKSVDGIYKLLYEQQFKTDEAAASGE